MDTASHGIRARKKRNNENQKRNQYNGGVALYRCNCHNKIYQWQKKLPPRNEKQRKKY